MRERERRGWLLQHFLLVFILFLLCLLVVGCCGGELERERGEIERKRESDTCTIVPKKLLSFPFPLFAYFVLG